MKCICVLSLLLFHICLGMKEEYTSLISEKLIHDIEKKLAKLDEEESNSCHFSAVSDTIIKTRDSIAAGATFLKSPTTGTTEECQDECCSTETCNLAVFKEKDDHACYLFDCGEPSVCNFTSHPGFVSMTVIGGRRPKNQPSPPEKHADDLQKLANGDTGLPSTTIATTTIPPTTTTLIPTTTTEKEPVTLYGECQLHKDCAGSRTECLAGYCLCQAGYHAQDGACRKDCTRFEFECANSGQPMMYPQCIAIYDKCDGIKHCTDTSDEMNCKAGINDQDMPALIPQGQLSSDIAQASAVNPQLQPQNAYNLQPPVQPQPAAYQPQIPKQVYPNSQVYQNAQVPQQGYQTSINQPVGQQAIPQYQNVPVNPQQPQSYVPSSQGFQGQYVPQVQPQPYKPVQTQVNSVQDPRVNAQPVNVIQNQQTVNRQPERQNPPVDVLPSTQGRQGGDYGYQTAQDNNRNIGSHNDDYAYHGRLTNENRDDVVPVVPYESKVPVLPSKSNTDHDLVANQRSRNRKPSINQNNRQNINQNNRQNTNQNSRQNINRPNNIGIQQTDTQSDNKQQGPQDQSKTQPKSNSNPNRGNTMDSTSDVSPIKGNIQESKTDKDDQYFYDDRDYSNVAKAKGPFHQQNSERPSEVRPKHIDTNNAVPAIEGGYVPINRKKPIQTADQRDNYDNQYIPYKANDRMNAGGGTGGGGGGMGSNRGNYGGGGGGVGGARISGNQERPGAGPRQGYNNRYNGNTDNDSRTRYNNYYHNYDNNNNNDDDDYYDFENHRLNNYDYNDNEGRGNRVNHQPSEWNYYDTNSYYQWNEPRKPPKTADSDADLPGKLEDKPDIESNTQNIPPKISYGKDGLRAPEDVVDHEKDLKDQEENSNDSDSSEDNKQAASATDEKEENSGIVSATDSVKSSKSTSTTIATSTEVDNNNPPDKKEDGDATSNVKVEEVVADTGVNAEEKTLSVIQSNKGAVIALALGLAVTAMLLVFVGCRLRNVKRRLRRGRPLNSNEADYLINGMYL